MAKPELEELHFFKSIDQIFNILFVLLSGEADTRQEVGKRSWRGKKKHSSQGQYLNISCYCNFKCTMTSDSVTVHAETDGQFLSNPSNATRSKESGFHFHDGVTLQLYCFLWALSLAGSKLSQTHFSYKINHLENVISFGNGYINLLKIIVCVFFSK